MDYDNDQYQPEDNQVYSPYDDDAYYIHPVTGKKVYLDD